MKSDTDQLVRLIRRAETYSISELCPEIPRISDEQTASYFLGLIPTRLLNIPKGTVFRVAGLDKVLQRTYVLIIAGDIATGNVVICIDRPALDLETILYSRSPNLVGVVRSLSFPSVNTPSTAKALKGILKTYQDLVLKVQVGILPKEHRSQTLLNFIHEYVLTSKITSEYTPEVYD